MGWGRYIRSASTAIAIPENMLAPSHLRELIVGRKRRGRRKERGHTCLV